jgi:CHAT domain-containing protein/tetratricopeptide (TPR) repeat protein
MVLELMVCFRRARAVLILPLFAIPPARAAVPADLPACEALLARSRSEDAALCLYEVAAGKGPSRTAAARRLEVLRAKHPEDPWFSLQLARYKWRTQDPREMAEAERLYRRTAELAADTRLPRAECQARAGISRMLRDAGRMTEATAELAHAVRLAEVSRDNLLLMKLHILQAEHWAALGQMEEAYNLLRRIKQAEKSSILTRDYLFVLGNVTHQTGRLREASDAYRRLAELTRATGETLSEAMARRGLAAIRQEELIEMPTAGGRQEVIELSRRAWNVTRAAAIPAWEAQSLWILGSLADGPEAVAHLERCFAVATTPRDQSNCRSALARRLAASDPAAAERAVDQALTLARESGDPLAWTYAWQARMRVSWAHRPLEQALKDSEAALDAIEALRNQQAGSAWQPGLFSTWAESYYWLSGRLVEAARLEEAFGVVERMRARTLTDALGVARQAPGTSELHARRADVFLAIARVQRRLLDPDLGTKERAEARAELERLEAEETELRSRIARADPHFESRPTFASLAQVRGALAPDQALLSFQVAPWQDLAGGFGGGSWLLVSTRTATRVYRLPDRVELRPNVELFTGLFAGRDGSEAQVSSILYEKLLGKAMAELPAGVRRLVIIPDDALHRLPFAALRPAAGSDPLATRFEITLAPSATLRLRWRQGRPTDAALTALVFADPVSFLTAGQAASERSAIFAVATRLGPLPQAREEGGSVVRHLGGRLLAGEDASETYIKRNGAGRFGLLHFATHASTDDVEPDRSFVLLAPGDAKEDGLLQVREIVDLDLDGRVVVLSSCESASGEILRGEGVMGLARAFFQAGAHTVVASLWPLRDDDGAALFDRFYHHLGQGETVAAALQAAQRDRMDDGAPAAAWAGVVVLGDGDRVPLPGGRRGSGAAVWVALAVLLLLVSAGLQLRKRRGGLSAGV